ncbi:MAG: hypothetical protein AB1659_01905 [Thermodesulfobacteriota bacterium]
MKKIGVISLTRRNSLAYSALKKIILNLGYEPICGERIGADSIFFPIEEFNLVGHDFLADFFVKAGFSEADAILVSAPYTVNLFMLPKLIRCLRAVNSAPILLGGNEASNNYKTLMTYRFTPFVNHVVDVAPDFIVRGTAESALYDLLPMLDQHTMTSPWTRSFFQRLLDIPNLAFWIPGRRALVSTCSRAIRLPEKDIFLCVKYGEHSGAITFQRACIWSKKSRGGCLFCAIAGQFGEHFHAAVETDSFEEEYLEFLRKNPDITHVDIWDDTFNMDEAWTASICRKLKKIREKTGRDLIYSCFLRPKGLPPSLIDEIRGANIKAAFIGADAVTEDLSKRFRRGCTVSDLNRSIESLSGGRIIPGISVQLFSPESTVDDLGTTLTTVLNCIKNGHSTAHVHLYTFPLVGSDIHRLLEARNNLKRIPSPLLKTDSRSGYEAYGIAYDYVNYDPDVEAIKRKTYALLNLETSFYVKTYPGDEVDAEKLKSILRQIRSRSIEVKKHHPIKVLWLLAILCQKETGDGLSEDELLGLLSKNERVSEIPENLRKTHGDFGYRYTLSRSIKEVAAVLVENRWACRTESQKLQITPQGKEHIFSQIKNQPDQKLNIASFGTLDLDHLKVKII